MRMIECITYNSKRTLLINIDNISYCYLIEKDGYGCKVDNIKIVLKDSSQLELENGKEIYETLREVLL